MPHLEGMMEVVVAVVGKMEGMVVGMAKEEMVSVGTTMVVWRGGSMLGRTFLENIANFTIRQSQ